MSGLSCSNCGYTPSPAIPYLESPCATCRLALDIPTTKRPALFDSCGSKENADGEEASYLARIDKDLEHAGDDPTPEPSYDKLTPEMLQTLKRAMEEQIYGVLSGTIIKFLRLGRTSPIMLELVLKKMQYPYMSYSELGASMKEPFSKQNVLYHLKHAVEIMPELASVLLTDTRFSGGRYALQTLANKRRKEAAMREIKGLLYGDDNPELQARPMRELNAVLHAPFMLSDEALDFNPYIADEDPE